MAPENQNPDTDLVKAVKLFSDADLIDIKSFDDALALLGPENFVNVGEVLGDGFETLDKKDKLVDVPFIVIKTKEVDGDWGGTFSVIHLVTESNKKYVLLDGSTGIHKQLGELRERFGGDVPPLVCKHGLRRSDYEYTDEQGQTKPATTYYLDTSS